VGSRSTRRESPIAHTVGKEDDHVKRHRHTPEQAVRKVREGKWLLNDAKDLVQGLGALEISEATWNRWRAQYGG
jgi:transcription elongation factor GreA-like protein